MSALFNLHWHQNESRAALVAALRDLAAAAAALRELAAAAVKELAADGESTREIAKVVGVDHATVARDLSVANATSEDQESEASAQENVANATAAKRKAGEDEQA